MDVKEIAKELTEAALAKATLNDIMGHGVKVGDAQKIGSKVGELYKGILLGVVDAIDSTQKKTPSA